MAELYAKQFSTAAVILHPLKGVDSLPEWYSKDTADVFFVEKETKERLPVHREVLKVASPVFYKMFSGDMKEKDKKEIPAPEEYNWESFKAAITLLYGEEVEVEESSVPDIYRVAHLYDLREVIAILVHEICQWDSDMVNTVVELCVLAQGKPDRKNSVLNASLQYIASHLGEVSPSHIAQLTYETMLTLVKSEQIASEELVLLRLLHQWTSAQSDITLNEAKQLYSHIRFGTIPYENLAECSVIGHDNLKSALENHQKLSFDRVRVNSVQVTPRTAQKEVFQVYPLGPGIKPMVLQNGQVEVANLTNEHAVGVIYCGRQELRFELDMEKERRVSSEDLCLCRLCSLHDSSVVEAVMELHISTTQMGTTPIGTTQSVRFPRATVVLDQTGAQFVLTSKDLKYKDTSRKSFKDKDTSRKSFKDKDTSRKDYDLSVKMNMDLPFTGHFPWVLMLCMYSAQGKSTLTFHPPTC